MTSEKFTIDDAFEPEEDEKIRVYGSTKLTPKRGPKVRQPVSSTSDEIPLTDYQYDEEPSESLLAEKKSRRNFVGSSTYSIGSSWSGETVISNKSFQDTRWWRHPKIRENFRVVLGAIALTGIGLALFVTGIGIVASPQRGWHSLVFFIGGSLCLIPGAYHLTYIILAIRGVNGYSLYNLPVFNR